MHTHVPTSSQGTQAPRWQAQREPPTESDFCIVDGLKIELNRDSASGYKFVTPGNGCFHVQFRCNGNVIRWGQRYDTALDAAVAFAQHKEQPPIAKKERKRSSCSTKPCVHACTAIKLPPQELEFCLAIMRDRSSESQKSELSVCGIQGCTRPAYHLGLCNIPTPAKRVCHMPATRNGQLFSQTCNPCSASRPTWDLASPRCSSRQALARKRRREVDEREESEAASILSCMKVSPWEEAVPKTRLKFSDEGCRPAAEILFNLSSSASSPPLKYVHLAQFGTGWFEKLESATRATDPINPFYEHLIPTMNASRVACTSPSEAPIEVVLEAMTTPCPRVVSKTSSNPKLRTATTTSSYFGGSQTSKVAQPTSAAEHLVKRPSNLKQHLHTLASMCSEQGKLAVKSSKKSSPLPTRRTEPHACALSKVSKPDKPNEPEGLLSAFDERDIPSQVKRANRLESVGKATASSACCDHDEDEENLPENQADGFSVKQGKNRAMTDFCWENVILLDDEDSNPSDGSPRYIPVIGSLNSGSETSDVEVCDLFESHVHKNPLKRKWLHNQYVETSTLD